MNTNILQDLQICISVPLSLKPVVSVATGQVILYLVSKISLISVVSCEIISYVVFKISVVSVVSCEIISYLVLKISVVSNEISIVMIKLFCMQSLKSA